MPTASLIDGMNVTRSGHGAVPSRRPMRAAPGMGGGQGSAMGRFMPQRPQMAGMPGAGAGGMAARFAQPMQPRSAPRPTGGGMGAARGMFGRGGGAPGGMSAARGMFGRGGGAPGGGAMGAARGMAGGGARPQMPGGAMGAAAGGMFGGGGGGARPAMPSAAMRFGGMLSDERSKERIRELEGIKQRYEALLDTPSATAESFRSVGSHEFEYKPEFQDQPGAGRGRFAGPMTRELRQIPGVVEEGPDGMERVNDGRLSLATASATGELSREVEDLRSRLAALSDDPDATLDVAGGRRR